MKYFVIGDIHGRYDLLEKLLIEADRQYPDAMRIFLGDMVDRGPDSFKVVECVKKLTESGKAIALLGNHEDMMLDYIRSKIVDRNHVWFINGARRTIDSYGHETHMYGQTKFFGAAVSSGHWKWLSELPLYYETDEVWFSHAPIPRLEHMPRDFRVDRDLLTWTHIEFDEGGTGVYDHGKIAVCGHQHASRHGIFVPRVYDKIVYVDTGCGCWEEAPLTGVVIEDGKYAGYIQTS